MVSISVIMKIFDGDINLKKSLDSVISQTFDEIEVICICSESNPNHIDILNNYVDKYEFIKIIYTDDINNAIDISKGEYIIFLDANTYLMDDIVFKKLSEVTVSNNLNLLSGNIYKKNKVPFDFIKYYDNNELINSNDYQFPCLLNKHLIKKDFIVSNNIIYPNFSKSSDELFLAEILSKMDEIYVTDLDICIASNYVFDDLNQISHYKSLLDDLEDDKFKNYRLKVIKVLTNKLNQLNSKDLKANLNLMGNVFKDNYSQLRDIHNHIYINHLNDSEITELCIDENNPRISVIIPVYNAEPFLDDALNSILNQTFGDFEIVCVNDGSKDNSLKILNDYSKKDARIKVFDKENGGCGSARNRGIDEAIGNYVYFFDPDDEVSINTFEESYKNAINNNTDMVVFKANAIIDDKITNERTFFNFERKFKNVDFNNFIFTYHDLKNQVLNGAFAPWSKLYKKEFLDSYDDFKFDIGLSFDDGPFHVKSMLRAKSISFVNKYLYHYRMDNPNSSINVSSKGFDVLKIIEINENFLKKEGYFEEFLVEFHSYVIKHVSLYILSTNSEEYYRLAREKYSQLDKNIVKKIPYYQEVYNLVMNIEDYSEFKFEYQKFVFEKEINSLTKKIESINKDCKKLKKENKKLKKKNKKLKKENGEILSSTSWKVTKPLRKLKLNFK